MITVRDRRTTRNIDDRFALMISDTATAPVRFGLAIGRPPKAAQVPTETTAAAPSATSLSISRLLIPRSRRKLPPRRVGSGTIDDQDVFPQFSFIAAAACRHCHPPQPAAYGDSQGMWSKISPSIVGA